MDSLGNRLVDIEALASAIGSTKKQLCFYAFNAPYSARYITFDLPKKAGDYRKIEAPRETLKHLQRQIYKLLAPFYHEPQCVHGFATGKSIITNSTAHITTDQHGFVKGHNKQMRHLVVCDIEDFFGSIGENRIFGLMTSLPFGLPEPVARCIARICTTTRGLPQGAPTSPLLSNMIFRSSDYLIMKFAREHRIVYTRYADDLVFSIRNERTFRELFMKDGAFSLPKDLVTIIESPRGIPSFSLNKTKTKHMGKADRQIITGIVANEKPNLRRKYYRHLRTCIHVWAHQGAWEAAKRYHHKTDVTNEDALKLEERIRGKLEHYRNVTTCCNEASAPLMKLGSAFNRLCEGDKFREHLPEDSIFNVTIYDDSPFADPDGPGASEATAFLLDKYGIVTAKHAFNLANGYGKPRVVVDVGSPLGDSMLVEQPAIVRKNHKDYDCVKLKIDERELERHFVGSAPLFASPDYDQPSCVHLGQVVYAWKHINMGEGARMWQRIEGHILKISHPNNVGHVCTVDATYFKGMSGGPVTNKQGRVIGVVYAGRDIGDADKPMGTSRFITLEWIDEIENGIPQTDV